MGSFPRLNEKETRKSVNKDFKMRQLHSNWRINNSPTLIDYWQQTEISYKRKHKQAWQYPCHVNLIYGFASTHWFWTSNREVVGSVPWQEHSDFFPSSSESSSIGTFIGFFSLVTEMEDRCHVFQENGNIYSATLGLVDIVRGANSYYKLQLLKDDKKNS